MVEDIGKFGSLEMLESFLFELFNVHKKRAYSQRAGMQSKFMGEAVNIIDEPIQGASLALKFQKIGTNGKLNSNLQSVRNGETYFVKKGKTITL